MSVYNEKLAWCIEHAPDAVKKLPVEKILEIMESSYAVYLQDVADDSVETESVVVTGINDCCFNLPFVSAFGLYQLFAVTECKSFYTENVIDNIDGFNDKLLQSKREQDSVKEYFNENVLSYALPDYPIATPSFEQVFERYKTFYSGLCCDSTNYWDNISKTFVKRCDT